MNIFVYADESGVFDPKHNEYFVFGGLIFLGEGAKDDAIRKYRHVEKVMRKSSPKLASIKELKACSLSNKQKGKVIRSLNGEHKFGVVIEQKRLLAYVCSHKKTKQRYLDYVFKIALRRAFQSMLCDGVFKAKNVENVFVRVDQHSTATNERYELQESLEEELKYGVPNFDFDVFRPPIFPDMDEVTLEMRDSAQDPLIRAADMVANRLYYCACQHNYDLVKDKVRYRIVP